MRLSIHIFVNRNFVRYWLAGWLSSLGDSVFIVALTWMLAQQTGSPLVVGTYLAIVGAIKVVFVLAGGLIVLEIVAASVIFFLPAIRQYHILSANAVSR